jgi:hypothetical protein
MRGFKGELKLLENEGLVLLYGEPMIIHCNHYNLFLQRTIEDAGDYIPATKILTEGSVIVVYSMLRRLFEEHPNVRQPFNRLKVAADLYAQLGLGLLPLDGLTENGGQVTTSITHYSLGWRQKWGRRKKPVDYFTCGYIQAALAIAFYNPPSFYKVIQKRCLSMGDTENMFEAVLASRNSHIPASPGMGVTIKDASGRKPIPSHVDETGITNIIRDMPLEGNKDGLIPAFGVYITRNFANYYNYISFETARAITEVTGEPELARDLFIEAGAICAFNTLGGVMVSDEWAGLIEPQCQSREDWLSGVIAVANAFGWGYWTVTELEPNKRMVIRVDGSYESNAYLAMYGQAAVPNSYLVTGGAGGLMNLLYHADITKKPELSEAFYRELFSKDGSFLGQQVQCRSMGDDICEIEVTRI